MKRKTSNPDEHKRSVRFKAISIEEMEKLAAIRKVTVSDIVREYVEKGLKIMKIENKNNSYFIGPGVGYVTTVGELMQREKSEGCKVIVVDIEKEYKELVKRLPNKVSSNRINPLAIK